MRGRGQDMAEPETDATDISVRAAEVATDVSETDQPAKQRRLVSSFTRAAVTGGMSAMRRASSLS